MKVINFLLVLLLCIPVFTQTRYLGPDDPAGDQAWVKSGVMDANRVLLKFKNTTQLSDWPDPDAWRWPNDYTGCKMSDGVALMVAGRVYVTDDSIPVDNLKEAALLAAAGELDTLYYCQTNYREEQDADPNTDVFWNMQPVPGYCNPDGDTPAMSNDPDSWPPEGWPDPSGGLMWKGDWWGRAGRGKISADLETFFVVNDAQDQEYLPLDSLYHGPRYYPRPGRFIGDNDPDVSTQKGAPWGGLGLRIEMRGYQWNNALARDMIFWECQVANISDYDLNELMFGLWDESRIQGRGNDMMFYSDSLDLVFAWDPTGVGSSGQSTGICGIGFLETPDNPNNQTDDDGDGLIDERRDNEATALVGPTSGISDLEAFLSYFHDNEDELRTHWDADEDQDWQDGCDVNGNGRYDYNEDPGDDIGLDGIGPQELNYPGPDVDGTECDHRPDFIYGVGCEPNFGYSDVSESDMTGLSMFSQLPIPSHTAPYTHWFRNDQSMWELLSETGLAPYLGSKFVDFAVFGVGPFALPRSCENRFSFVLVHSYDPIVGLNPDDKRPDALFRQKEIAQIIYEQDYQLGWISEQHDPGENPTLPPSFALRQNYPNPFNSKTKIRFVVNRWCEVEIAVYGVTGQKIETLLKETKTAGKYDLTWDAGDLPSGVYLLSMRAGSFTGARKMILAR